MEEKVYKKYVQVGAVFTPGGRLIPVWIGWEDGRRFHVDRILSCVRAASRKAGGVGWRYTCMIGGRETVLYYEDNFRWFVEAKVMRE